MTIARRFPHRNPHFWLIAVISLSLIFVYQTWPWREEKFASGVWQWFSCLSTLQRVAVAESMNHIVGILFLVPIIYAAMVFSWRGAFIAFLASLAGTMRIMLHMWPPTSLAQNLLLLSLPFWIASIVSFELAWHRRERRIFAEREAERQIYIAKILESEEDERRRIARQLHDDIIQNLLVIANDAQMLLSSASLASHLYSVGQRIRGLAIELIDNLRRIAVDLRPSVLDNLGLVAALRWLADRTSEDTGIEVNFSVQGAEKKLPDQVEITIFRIVQEGLANVKRHSEATKVAVTLKFSDERVSVTVQDNGKGFACPSKISTLAVNGKLGLVGLVERVTLLKGTFLVHSEPGMGTSLFAELPY